MQRQYDSGCPHELEAVRGTDCADADEPKSSPVSHAGKRDLFLIVTALVATVDQLSKLWIEANRPRMELLPGFLDLVYVTNPGAAFGLLASHTELLIALGIAGSVAIVVFFRYFSPASTVGILAFALVLGGAVGNLTDRIRLGFVIDFISVQFVRWPPFNVADAAITVGIFALIYYLYTSGAFRKAYERGHRPRD